MPASVKTVSAVNDIIAGNGYVTLEEALIALGAATGLVVLSKKIGLWERLSPVERHEMEMLDDTKPESWFRRVKDTIPAAAFQGHKLKWRKGSWSVGTADNGDIQVVTPMLDEESDQLLS